MGTPSESSQLFQNLSFSFDSSLNAAPLAVSSWYGRAWPLVAVVIASPMSWRTRRLVAGALIVIPALAAMATLDGTRVFVCVAALPALAALWTYAKARTAALQTSGAGVHAPADVTTWLGLLVVTTLLVPALYYRGDMREVWLPWAWFSSGAHLN